MKQLLTGAGVALITPFTSDGEIDYDALERLVEYQIAAGTDYLVALGTTAETPTLSDHEKKSILSLIIRKNRNRVPLVAGIGGNCTEKLVQKMKEFDFEGVDAILSVTPYYNRPTQEGLYRHYMELASHSSKPVLLYNVPARTGTNLEAETVVRLANASEKFIGVKEASGNLVQVTKIIRETPSSFLMISGDDSFALPIISLGGKGVISVIGNAFPGKMSSLAHHALQGDCEAARKHHDELSVLFSLLFREGNPAGVKALMHLMGMIRNELRLPLCRISETLTAEISRAAKQIAGASDPGGSPF